ncbi:MAG: diacylglycerol kinase family protein [Solobacterium sp.]|nr:diacylglycerol kinase family protein [Solobacterium sp.]
MIRKKFEPAFSGLLNGLRHRSILTQYVLGAGAIIAGLILKLTYMEWIAVLICIGMVITAEYLNTAIEFICNYLTIRKDDRIRVIKDIAAGAVLASSLCALTIALMILGHHLH